MTPRMHAEIENLTPVLEKINKGVSLDYNETATLNSITEKMISDIFDWIQAEKKREPISSLVLETGLYTRFVSAYGTARESNDKLKKTYTENIKNQLIGLSSQVTAPKSAITNNEKSIDSSSLISLKNTPEQGAKSPFTSAELSRVIENLKNLRDANDRAISVSALWSKMSHNGYNTLIQGDTVIVQHNTDSLGAKKFETQLQESIKAGILTVKEIQTAMIIGSDSFEKYYAANKNNIDKTSMKDYVQFIMKVRNIDLQNAKNPAEEAGIIRKSKATEGEKAILISYMGKGLNDYNMPSEMQRQSDLRKVSKEISASPAMKDAVKAVQVASNGGIQAEEKRRQEAGEEKLDWNTFINNPMKAVAKYPWTSLGVILGSMYKFGIMKTLLGLVGGVLGYKIVDEWGGIEALNKKEAQKNPDRTNNAPKNNPKPAINIPSAKSIDTQGIAGARLAATNRVKQDPQLSGMVETIRKSQAQKRGVENADLADYVAFINTELQSKKTSEIINPQDFRFSVFSDDEFLDKSGKNNLNTIMLKRIIRVYLGVDMRTSVPSQNMKKGEQEQKSFVSNYSVVLSKKDSTFKDLVDAIK